MSCFSTPENASEGLKKFHEIIGDQHHQVLNKGLQLFDDFLAENYPSIPVGDRRIRAFVTDWQKTDRYFTCDTLEFKNYFKLFEESGLEV